MAEMQCFSSRPPFPPRHPSQGLTREERCVSKPEPVFKQKSFISLLRPQLINIIHFVSHTELSNFFKITIRELDFCKLIQIVGPSNVTLKNEGN